MENKPWISAKFLKRWMKKINVYGPNAAQQCEKFT